MNELRANNVLLNAAKEDINGHPNAGFVAQDGTVCAEETAQRRGRRSEPQRSADLGKSLPRLIQIGRWRDGRTKEFYVRFGKDRVVESFSGEQERNDRAEKLAEDREHYGSTTLNVDWPDWRRWQDFRKRVPASIDELEALWKKFGRHDRMATKEAVRRFIALRKEEKGSGGSDAHRHMGLHLRRLVEGVGEMPLDDVKAEHLRLIVHGLVNSKTGGEMALQTKHDHVKNWNNFFVRCVLEEWCTKNPCLLVLLPAVDAVDKVILTTRNVFDLLKANRNEPVIGRMVFELFGGLRASSAARLKADHVKRAIKGVRLPGAVIDEKTNETTLNHKSGKTMFRQGHPDVLWEWFDHAQARMWDVRKGSYDEYKRQAFIRAGVQNPGNILRDTFASYLFAATNNLPLVSSLMQHTSVKTTLIYVGIAEEADAKLVMAMTPKNILMTWAKFVASINPPIHT